MPKVAARFKFSLHPSEIDEIKNAAGSGGQQTLHRRLVAELEEHGGAVTFSDEQIGILLRYMTQYGSGGFQSRLRKAFERSLKELLGF